MDFDPSDLPVQAPLTTSQMARLRVLLVENDTLQRDLMAAALAHWGVVYVKSAARAEAALFCLSARAFDLVITDLRLPDMGSEAFLQCATALHHGAFVVLSGSDPAQLEQATLAVTDAGAHLLGAMEKPPRFSALYRLVRDCAHDLPMAA